jgi:hypothetical protein
MIQCDTWTEYDDLYFIKDESPFYISSTYSYDYINLEGMLKADD